MNTDVAALADALPDILGRPGEDRYRRATAPRNASFPQQPTATVHPRSAAEVASAVTAANRLGLRVHVQATGHGSGGPIGADTVLLDTAALNRVSVDPSARTARIGAGATWPAVQSAAIAHRLLGLSGTSPSVGVAGYLFGGGVSWFVRPHGLAAGTLRAVDYVDGTGRPRRAAPDAPDVLDREALWSFRGGAPVGVATDVEIDLVAAPALGTGLLLWPARHLGAVARAWVNALNGVDERVTSTLAMVRLPPDGPFPESLRGQVVVHLSYATLDGPDRLEPLRSAVRAAAEPAVDTTGPGDPESLAGIHLDPPAAVPARGAGRWVRTAEQLADVFEAARIGAPGGLNMVELRHTACGVQGPPGACATVPAEFLLHAVGPGGDDAARRGTDRALAAVEAAAAQPGPAAPAFRDGQPDAGDALTTADLDRIAALRTALDPDRVLSFARDATAGPA